MTTGGGPSAARLSDSSGHNLEQREGQDVDISRGRGVGPPSFWGHNCFLRQGSGGVFWRGGIVVATDASELISGRTEQMLSSQTSQFIASVWTINQGY